MDINNVFFSIIIPVYDTEKYIPQCINSVISQAYTNFEIIIVDDGSKDNSLSVCKVFQENNKSITIIQQKNQGQASARNAGIRIAHGKYIVFLDSDDSLCPNGLQKLYDSIKKNNYPDIVLIRRKSFTDSNSNLIPCSYYFDDQFNNLSGIELFKKIQTYKDFYFAPWSFVIEKSFLEEKNLFFKDGNMHEDEEWIPRILVYSKTIGYCNDFFYLNRENRVGSVSSLKNIKKLLDRIEIANMLSSEFDNQKYSITVRHSICSRCCKLVFGTVCDFYKYLDDAQINLLKKKIEDNIYYLKADKSLKYIFTYFSCRILGVKNTSILLLRFRKTNYAS